MTLYRLGVVFQNGHDITVDFRSEDDPKRIMTDVLAGMSDGSGHPICFGFHTVVNFRHVLWASLIVPETAA